MALDWYCTRVVPRPSFYRYYSFNSGLDESVSFKPGTVSKDDVLLIAHELGPSWKMFGRVLKVSDAVIDQIEADESKVSEKCYRKCNCVVIMGYDNLTCENCECSLIVNSMASLTTPFRRCQVTLQRPF